MKKICALVLALLLIQSAALAADLSGMSFDELLALRDQVQRELISRPEWKEVTVPPGEYTIGIDIPAGVYSISYAGKRPGNFRVWGAAVKDYKANGGLLINTSINKDDPLLARLVLKEGNVLETTTAILMTPYQGLGF